MYLDRGLDTENVIHYTMEYHSAIKHNEFMKFLDKCMKLENIILSEVTQSQKNIHGMHSLISDFIPIDWNTQDTSIDNFVLSG